MRTTIDVADPVSVCVETFDTEHQDKRFIKQYVRENYDLTTAGIIDTLHFLDVDYNKVSSYGHVGGKDVPWEEKPSFAFSQTPLQISLLFEKKRDYK